MSFCKNVSVAFFKFLTDDLAEGALHLQSYVYLIAPFLDVVEPTVHGIMDVTARVGLDIDAR